MISRSRLAELKAKLDACRPLTPGELERLREQFTIEYTYNSNAIEGNTLTLRETALVLEGITIGEKPLKDHLEAIGHRDAFACVERLVSEKEPLTEWRIREIHSLVLMDRPEDKGRYRKVPVVIAGAFHTPTEPLLIHEEMAALLRDFAATDKNAVEAAALFHLRFEGIHPFIDGNGRTGRLLLNFMLMQAGFPPVNVKYSDRRRYYAAFDSYYRDGDSAPMTGLVAECLEARLLEYLKILR